MIFPDSPSNTGPRLRNNKHALPNLALLLLHDLPSRSIQNNRIDPEERHSSTARFRRDSTRERRDHDTARLSLPPRIDNGALAPPHILVVPQPRLAVDRLADGAEDAQGGEVVFLDVLGAEAAEKADRGGRAVELGDLVFVDCLPVARGGGVDGCGFEYSVESKKRRDAESADEDGKGRSSDRALDQ